MRSLTVRDLSGLAGRMAETVADEWEDGFAHLYFSGQDIGVLDELLFATGNANTTRMHDMSELGASAIKRLRNFLREYLDGP